MLGIVALAANLMAAAIPVAIGAAVTAGIAAFALLVEDIMSYFNGDKSVTGLIVNAFEGAWDAVVQYAMDKFTMLKNWMSDLVPDWMSEDMAATNARLGGGANFGAMGSVAGQAALQASYGGHTYQYNFNGYNGSDIEHLMDKHRRKNNAMTAKQLGNGGEY